MKGDEDHDKPSTIDGADMSERQMKKALERKPIIDTLLISGQNTGDQVREAAKKLQCSPRTVWYLVKRYGRTRRLVDLAPRQGRGRSGMTFIKPEVEDVISDVLNRFHLSRMRPTVAQTVMEIRRKCASAGLPPPDDGTIKRRLKKIPDIEIIAAREGKKFARERYKAMPGKTLDTQWPLQRVQIDHTMVDLIVVDELNRQPLRRPYLTLAIDEFSRAILGFHVSLEAPSATSVGLCLVHSILPKEQWAGRIGLQFDWPMHGRPDCLYVDNGSDFHSEAVEKGCIAWGMNIEYRPPGMPHFGGIVERMIRTAMGAVKILPGATGGSIAEKGDRDPDAGAAMTLKELERFFATFFAGQYHRTPHTYHSKTPNTRWREGIFGTTSQAGRGIPPVIDDPERLLIDFLPLERRRITQRGIRWGGVHYMDDVLREYMGSNNADPFIVRRDPRDISSIWFLSPNDGRYYHIRSRDIARPSVSLWELEAARQKVRLERNSDYDEAALFEAVEAQRQIVEKAAENKAAARKGRLAVERRARNAEGTHKSYEGLGDTSSRSSSHRPWSFSRMSDLPEDDIFEIDE